MKLRNLLKVFSKKDLVTNQTTLKRDFNILNNYLGIMFPFDVEISQFMVNLEKNKKRTNHPFINEFLPFHTQDKKWLAKYLYQLTKDPLKKDKQFLQQFVSEKSNEKKLKRLNFHQVPSIKYASVEAFVTTKEFNEARDDYEENFTRSLIDYLINNNDPLLSQQENNIDEIFRQDVMNITEQIGINPRSVEISLEKNANFWCKQILADIFYSRYTLIPFIEKRVTDRVAWDKFLFEREQYKPAWLKQQLYRYYIKHKTMINKLGLKNPEMEISENAIQVINEQIALFEDKYETFTGHRMKNRTEPIKPNDNKQLNDVTSLL